MFNQEALPGFELLALTFSSRLKFNVVVMLEQMAIAKQQAIAQETKTIITDFTVLELKMKYKLCFTHTSKFATGIFELKIKYFFFKY